MSRKNTEYSYYLCRLLNRGSAKAHAVSSSKTNVNVRMVGSETHPSVGKSAPPTELRKKREDMPNGVCLQTMVRYDRGHSERTPGECVPGAATMGEGNSCEASLAIPMQETKPPHTTPTMLPSHMQRAEGKNSLDLRGRKHTTESGGTFHPCHSQSSRLFMFTCICT